MGVMDLVQLHDLLSTAGTVEQVFGSLVGRPEVVLEGIRCRFREMALLVHPDRCPLQRQLAERAMDLLVGWRDRAEAVVCGRADGAVAAEFRLRTGMYRVYELLREGDYGPIYRCTKVGDGGGGEFELKVARRACDNDLIQREVKALRLLREVEEPGRRYLPRLVENFVWDGGVRRYAVIYACRASGVSLAQVRAAYPDGVDLRDAGWMFNRLLETLWFVHRRGLAHAAVLPPHVRLSVEDHGLILAEWAYAAGLGERLAVISGRHEAWYPPEVLGRAPVSAATDLAMAVRCLVYVLGGDAVTGELPATVPQPLRRFVRGCLLPAVSRCPSDAGALREEFGELLAGLYGKPVFRVFTMPK